MLTESSGGHADLSEKKAVELLYTTEADLVGNLADGLISALQQTLRFGETPRIAIRDRSGVQGELKQSAAVRATHAGGSGHLIKSQRGSITVLNQTDDRVNALERLASFLVLQRWRCDGQQSPGEKSDGLENQATNHYFPGVFTLDRKSVV